MTLKIFTADAVREMLAAVYVEGSIARAEGRPQRATEFADVMVALSATTPAINAVLDNIIVLASDKGLHTGALDDVLCAFAIANGSHWPGEHEHEPEDEEECERCQKIRAAKEGAK